MAVAPECVSDCTSWRRLAAGPAGRGRSMTHLRLGNLSSAAVGRLYYGRFDFLNGVKFQPIEHGGGPFLHPHHTGGNLQSPFLQEPEAGAQLLAFIQDFRAGKAHANIGEIDQATDTNNEMPFRIVDFKHGVVTGPRRPAFLFSVHRGTPRLYHFRRHVGGWWAPGGPSMRPSVRRGPAVQAASEWRPQTPAWPIHRRPGLPYHPSSIPVSFS